MERSFKFTLLLWFLYAVVMIFFTGHLRTVSINYWLAANHWLAEQPLYNHSGIGFIYFPQSAILYTLLTPFTFEKSEALWRVLSLSIFIWGLFRVSELISNLTQYELKKSFLISTLIAIPLCFDSLRNGQAHLLVTGLLALASYAISKKNWKQTAFLISLACFIKPTAVVYLLLVTGIFFAELGLYVFAWIAIFAFLPFLTASKSYVVSQYLSCAIMLTHAADLGQPRDWAQIFNLISQSGWDISYFFQNMIRVSLALVTLWMAYFIKNQNNLTTTALWLLMLAMMYLMLFNPRTENNDYMMLTPVLSYCMIEVVHNKKIFGIGFLLLLTFGFVDCFYISNLITGNHNWAAPLMAVILLFYLVFIFLCQRRAALTFGVS